MKPEEMRPVVHDTVVIIGIGISRVDGRLFIKIAQECFKKRTLNCQFLIKMRNKNAHICWRHVRGQKRHNCLDLHVTVREKCLKRATIRESLYQDHRDTLALAYLVARVTALAAHLVYQCTTNI